VCAEGSFASVASRVPCKAVRMFRSERGSSNGTARPWSSDTWRVIIDVTGRRSLPNGVENDEKTMSPVQKDRRSYCGFVRRLPSGFFCDAIGAERSHCLLHENCETALCCRECDWHGGITASLKQLPLSGSKPPYRTGPLPVSDEPKNSPAELRYPAGLLREIVRRLS
jgi:hypothetical protein